MNCPSRTDESPEHPDWNQNPPGLAADQTTRQDLNGIANLRTQRRASLSNDDDPRHLESFNDIINTEPPFSPPEAHAELVGENNDNKPRTEKSPSHSTNISSRKPPLLERLTGTIRRSASVIVKFARFVGPGFLVAVAYIDPGNYSTDVAAGAATKFGLLFIVLMSNVFAILLQSLAVRLGTVTGLNLAQSCREHLPKWLNIFLYCLGETAIIATDIAEVIGSAIALNLLLKIPLVGGCALTLVDVLIILLFYKPEGSMRRLRLFEAFVMFLVIGVVVCFCIQLNYIHRTGKVGVGEVFKGYLPSSAVVKGNGVYLSCGILGATVMPHSLYLGSGMVQPRLRQFDIDAGNSEVTNARPVENSKEFYRPSLAAINSCLAYSTVEVVLSLFLFALLVNSSILIVAGASLSSKSSAQSADLFGIYDLLAASLARAAGTVFALALLLSGISAGIVCTIAGQMLSEGALNWTIAPWLRRLITRSISITPSIIIAGAVGKEGLSTTLNITQVVLSVALPFVSAPLVYFTCRNKYMIVGGTRSETEDEAEVEVEIEAEPTTKKNPWYVCIFAVLVWLVIVIMNVALLVLVALGKA